VYIKADISFGRVKRCRWMG